MGDMGGVFLHGWVELVDAVWVCSLYFLGTRFLTGCLRYRARVLLVLRLAGRFLLL